MLAPVEDEKDAGNRRTVVLVEQLCVQRGRKKWPLEESEGAITALLLGRIRALTENVYQWLKLCLKIIQISVSLCQIKNDSQFEGETGKTNRSILQIFLDKMGECSVCFLY